jgi:hypothetical protein
METTRKRLADFPALVAARERLDARRLERAELQKKLDDARRRREVPRQQESRDARRKRLVTAAAERGISIEKALAEDEATRRAAEAAAAAESLSVATLEDGIAALDALIEDLRATVKANEEEAYRAMADAVKPQFASLAREFLGAFALAANVERRMREFLAAQQFPARLLPSLELRHKGECVGYVQLLGDAMRAAIEGGLLGEKDQELVAIRDEDMKLAALRPPQEEKPSNGRHWTRAEIEATVRQRTAELARA